MYSSCGASTAPTSPPRCTCGSSATCRTSDALLVGIGENAGVVDVGDGYAVTFKVESHNHPSYVEPYQGAATGVGGIVRDILTMGARPIAVMDSLRFGRADAPDTARVLPGVVAGVGGYGNCLGLPNIGGELLFDDCYAGNPLVNALCVGVHEARGRPAGQGRGPRQQGHPVRRPHRRRRHRRRQRAGVSETFDDDGPAKRPQRAGRRPVHREAADRGVPGDLRRRTWSPASRTSAAPGSPARPPSWPAPAPAACTSTSTPSRCATARSRPAEILMSESQERMCAIVEPAKVEQFLAVCRKWDVLATVIGEVTEGDRLTVDWHGERIIDVPPRTVAHEGPVYERPMARPRRPRRPAGRRRGALPRPTHRRELQAALAGRRQQPGRRRQDLGHRAVRPLRPRQHRARPARGRRRRPHRRGQRTAASRWRWTATPASPGSTRTPAPS